MIVTNFIASQWIKYGIPHAIAWIYKWINRRPTARQQRQAALDDDKRAAAESMSQALFGG